jgi:hypothetical protein
MEFSQAVRDIATGAVEPARAIGQSCHLAGMGIDTRDATVRADYVACSGIDTHRSLSARANRARSE